MRSFLSSHSRKVTEALNFTGHDTPRQLVVVVIVVVVGSAPFT